MESEEEEAVPSRPKFGAEEELSITSLFVVAFPLDIFPWADVGLELWNMGEEGQKRE